MFIPACLVSVLSISAKVTNPLDWDEVDSTVSHTFKMEDPHFDDSGFDPASAIREEGEREAGLIQQQEDSFIKSMLNLRDIEQQQDKGQPVEVHTKFVPRLRKLALD